MQNNRAQSWRTFTSFIKQACNFEPNQNSNAVLDELAKDLYTGVLQRRNELGHPIEPWERPSDLAESYLFVDEVNARPVMVKWRLVWSPEPERPETLTPSQEVEQFGWKGALQLEEKRIRALFTAGGIKIANTTLSERLQGYAKTHDIRTVGGVVPSANYIRNWVISKSKGKNPSASTVKKS